MAPGCSGATSTKRVSSQAVLKRDGLGCRAAGGGEGNQPVMCRILLGWMEAEQPRLVQPEGMKLLPRATEQSLPLPWEGIALGWGAKRSPVPLLQPGRSRASPHPRGGESLFSPLGRLEFLSRGLQVVASGRA